MAVYRRTARPRFTLLLLVLTSITVITLDYRGDGSGVIGTMKDVATDAFAPVQAAGQAVFEPVGNFLQGTVNYGDLEAENARLRAELEEVRGERVRAADAERERKELHDILTLEFAGDIPAVAARVVSTSPSNFELTVEIDRGRSAGVAEGMPVVSGAGLVGRVVQVSNNRSTILLLTDPTSSVGVRMISGDVGVATGRGRERSLLVEMIGVEAAVGRGEPLVTSGLQQSVFPPGIPVGRVRSARAEEGAFSQLIEVDPVVDFRRLTFVKVLQWSPGP